MYDRNHAHFLRFESGAKGLGAHERLQLNLTNSWTTKEHDLRTIESQATQIHSLISELMHGPPWLVVDPLAAGQQFKPMT
jgi:hypothetical protein